MKHLTNLEDFLNEKLIQEDTIEGYEYRFDFEEKRYIIKQGTKDKTIFGIKNKDGGWYVLTKGHLFDPEEHGMDRNKMVEFLQKGIKYFNIRSEVDKETLEDSEWVKFFDFELKKKPGRINKKYVILKLHCGKASAKWLTRKNNNRK